MIKVVFDGLGAEAIRVDWPEHEEVVLRVVEGTYPEWRKLIDNRTEPTEEVSFTPRTLRAVAKIGELYADHSIDWKLRGDLGVIDFSIGPLVSGLLMQARRHDAPAEDGDD